MMQRIGLCASSLCAIHCLLMPFVLAVQSFAISGLFHWFRISRVADNALLALAAVVGLIVCLQNLLQHRDLGPLALLFAGLAAVGIGRFLAWPPLITGGPLVMSYALWLNRRLCSCDTCHY
jgi:hypothetical protein